VLWEHVQGGLRIFTCSSSRFVQAALALEDVPGQDHGNRGLAIRRSKPGCLSWWIVMRSVLGHPLYLRGERGFRSFVDNWWIGEEGRAQTEALNVSKNLGIGLKTRISMLDLLKR